MKTSSEQLVRDLKAIQNRLGPVPLLLHTDLLQMGRIADPFDRQAFCAAYENVFEEAFGRQTYLIPTFNYEFCKTGIYDVAQTPSEVGALTDYYRRKYPDCRTRTPVFHFCIRHNQTFSLETQSNCFGNQSTFAQLAEAEGAVVFLGAPLSANTFVHHVEEINDVPYRFHKYFPGQVVWNGKAVATELVYRVRPLDATVTYAWERIEPELLSLGLLQEAPIGAGRALFFQAHALRDYWTSKLRATPHALLL